MSDKGFLTDHDQKFLRGQVEYDGEKAAQKRTQKRYRIRQRTRQAIKDFTVLWQHLDGEDLTNIFGDDKEENDELLEGIANLLAISYANFWLIDQGKELMSNVVETAITRSMSKFGGDITPSKVNVDIEITRNPFTVKLLKSIIEDNPDRLTLDQIGFIALSHEFGEEDINKIKESWEYPEGKDLITDASLPDNGGPADQDR